MYVHNNRRLLSRSSEYNEEETRKWDIGRDGFDLFQGVSFLNFATISLDEPKMEAVLFADDGE